MLELGTDHLLVVAAGVEIRFAGEDGAVDPAEWRIDHRALIGEEAITRVDLVEPTEITPDRQACGVVGRQGDLRHDEAAQVLRIVGIIVARSDEHTSELQSLMRISDAVFCLKTKTRNSTVITSEEQAPRAVKTDSL